MRARQISGLLWAGVCERPRSIPVSRPRGRKAAGVRYERELAKALPAALHGQWFQFQDRNGPGHCQTDLLLETDQGLAILEAKYTWTEHGHRQIEGLYKPVLIKAFRREVLGLVVCRVLTPDVARGEVCSDLPTALARAASGRRTVLHWIGQDLGLGPWQASQRSSHLATSLSIL